MERNFQLYYQTLQFITCLLISVANAKHSIISDQDALLSLKDHITLDPNQFLTKNWSTESSICSWIGVSCGLRHQRVTSLDISNMGLIGTLVPKLGNLSFLVTLNLSGNNFYGELPHELAQLSRLKHLDFGVNALSGEFPFWVGSLAHLELLYLNNNSLIGSIPSCISNLTNLKEFVCNGNELSGTIPFEIFNISSLEILKLSYNKLFGNLPTSMCRHLRNLKSIKLWSNMLSGSLPSDLSQCSQLLNFGLFNNSFSGPIPKEFWSMKMLKRAFFASNELEGTIPKVIGNMTNLEMIWLSDNKLTGYIPKEIGNLTNLQLISIAYNKLTGTIPEEFGNLMNMRIVGLSFNDLSGLVPAGLFNISTIEELWLNDNHLSGSLPSIEGIRLPNLEILGLNNNRLSGVIPHIISNSSRLRILSLQVNNFRGVIPRFLGGLSFLEDLQLSSNNFTMDSISFEQDFLRPLANIRNLILIDFAMNPLNVIFPKSIGNLSKSIERIYFANIGITGDIPTSIANLSNLMLLDLSDNNLSGSLPSTILSLQNLQVLSLSNNKLSGTLSCNVFGLKKLSEFYLYNNMFSGPIPECIGNGTSLRKILLSTNRFVSRIPMNVWNLKYLLEVDLSSNFLNSSLPVQFGNLHVLESLDLSMNNISGYIPDTIVGLQNLESLYLDHNLFEGSIPNSIGNIISLKYLDLSLNKLSGSIPVTLEKVMYLTYFNVSYNNLVGSIPSNGPFKNFTWESFISNNALCGDKRFHVSSCHITSPKDKWIKGHKHLLILCFGLVASIFFITLVGVYLIFQRNKNMIQRDEPELVTLKNRISFYELQYATDGYNERNLLGEGSFGSVYKGTLRDMRVVAVKVFNISAEGALKSFDVECEMLRNLRHRNLTHVISSCSNLDFKAIVLEYMPNGSLDSLLHSDNHFLSFNERLNIMIDVASALQYLHSGYPTPIVHADLKPSNILLDDDKVAHVSDFGIAKMLVENSIIFTNTLATFGYIAPEYGLEGLVSTKCDVYSFGITLMEVFTKKSPHDEMFNESLTLSVWVNNSMGSALVDILDDGLLNKNDREQFTKMMECVTMIMSIALKCTKVSPRERCDIGEVLAALNKIKRQL